MDNTTVHKEEWIFGRKINIYCLDSLFIAAKQRKKNEICIEIILHVTVYTQFP
jgi:hypothetical protein